MAWAWHPYSKGATQRRGCQVGLRSVIFLLVNTIPDALIYLAALPWFSALVAQRIEHPGPNGNVAGLNPAQGTQVVVYCKEYSC